MIYTLTTNPSIDYYLYNDAELTQGIHRCTDYAFIVAGKGVNVSRLLAQFQMKSTCVVVCGGFSGRHIEKELKKEKLLQTICIQVSQESRMNVKIRFHKKEMDINTSGPFVDAMAKEELLHVFDQVREDDIVCISGSLQNDMKDTLDHIAEKIHEKKAKLILDIPNITAAKIAVCHPYLIKPNLEELADLMQTEKELEKILTKAKSVFADKGIRVLVSLGEKGSCYISRDAIYQISSARVDKVINTVAAGDSMLAGFLYMLAKDSTLEDTLSFASAAGSASVMSSYLPDMDTVQKLLQLVSVRELWRRHVDSE